MAPLATPPAPSRPGFQITLRSLFLIGWVRAVTLTLLKTCGLLRELNLIIAGMEADVTGGPVTRGPVKQTR